MHKGAWHWSPLNKHKKSAKKSSGIIKWWLTEVVAPREKVQYKIGSSSSKKPNLAKLGIVRKIVPTAALIATQIL